MNAAAWIIGAVVTAVIVLAYGVWYFLSKMDDEAEESFE
jgi:hypothetical protein